MWRALLPGLARRWPVGSRVRNRVSGAEGTIVLLSLGKTQGAVYAIVRWENGHEGRISLNQLERLDS